MSYRPASPDSPRIVPVAQRGTVRSAVRAHAEDALSADAEECDRCECTGRITVVVDDGEGGYDGSARCPDCR